ncbi:MAG: GIY-YIG nuclease family protein [Candidatus Kapaibacterium sp.]
MTDSGAYQLVVRLAEDKRIEIGAFGEFDFRAGYYIYTGSAMRNLGQRIARHLRAEKTHRWHIDYLLAHPAASVVDVVRYFSEERIECGINQKMLKLPGASVPARGFGSSDCRVCPAHLLYFDGVNPFDI